VNDPKVRVSGSRHPARDPDRIVAAITRHVDIGIGDESGAVAFVVEAPDRAGETVFEFRASGDRLAGGEVSDGIDAVDRQAGVPVHHDAFGRRGAQCMRKRASRERQTKCQNQPNGPLSCVS
jgi:hypothetical protein